MSSLLTMNLIQVLCSKSTVNYQLKTLQIVKFVTFLTQNDNMLFICVPSDASSLPLLAGYLLLGIVFYLWETMKMWAQSIQPKFRPVRQGKVVYFKRWTSFFFRNFSGWTEPIHRVLDRNFRKFWLNGLRPWLSSTWSRLYVQLAYCAE